MNRTIKFRGKRVDNGEWVYGYLSYNQWHNSYSIGTGNYGSSFYQIIPETLGQFTGLTDKNGKEIYEGDLICVHKNHNGYLEVEFVNAYVGGWVLSHESTDRKLSLGARNRNDLEITGNIHDND